MVSDFTTGRFLFAIEMFVLCIGNASRLIEDYFYWLKIIRLTDLIRVNLCTNNSVIPCVISSVRSVTCTMGIYFVMWLKAFYIKFNFQISAYKKVVPLQLIKHTCKSM